MRGATAVDNVEGFNERNIAGDMLDRASYCDISAAVEEESGGEEGRPITR